MRKYNDYLIEDLAEHLTYEEIPPWDSNSKELLTIAVNEFIEKVDPRGYFDLNHNDLLLELRENYTQCPQCLAWFDHNNSTRSDVCNDCMRG